MSAADSGISRDLTMIARAVISAAVGVVQTVERVMVGDAQIRTARGNAWEAICADSERANRREEVRLAVAALATARADETVARAAGKAGRAAGTAARAAAMGRGQARGSRSPGLVRVGSSPRSSASHTSTAVAVAPARPFRRVARRS